MRLTWLVFVVAGRIGRGKKTTVRNRDTSLERIENSLWVYIIVQYSENKHATGQKQFKSASRLWHPAARTSRRTTKQKQTRMNTVSMM